MRVDARIMLLARTNKSLGPTKETWDGVHHNRRLCYCTFSISPQRSTLLFCCTFFDLAALHICTQQYHRISVH